MSDLSTRDSLAQSTGVQATGNRPGPGRPPNPTEEELEAARANPYAPETSEDALDALYEQAAAFISDFDDSGTDIQESTCLNPSAPTEAKPGSEDKVQMLAARYAAGLPLWHDSDCYDHEIRVEESEEAIHDEEWEEPDEAEML